MPHEAETGFLAERYHALPSEIEEEDISLLSKATVGVNVLRTLQTLDDLMDPEDPEWGEKVTADQRRIHKLVLDAMKDDDGDSN